MKAEAVRRLRSKGINLTDDQVAHAGRIPGPEPVLRNRPLRVRPAGPSFRRRAKDDTQVQAAIDLLGRARTPQALLGLTAAPRSPAN
jgi:hypothetical protein